MGVGRRLGGSGEEVRVESREEVRWGVGGG